MTGPGPRNLITDVPGLLVGNAEDETAITGVTVVLTEEPAAAAVDVRGGAPGTRETDLLDPVALVDRVDALVLSGGSAHGLDAGAGVMAWLASQGRGFAVGDVRVPIVPAAILFDLANGGDKSWREPPYRGLGQAAAAAAGTDFRIGNAGAGLGAKAGRLKGGLGSASFAVGDLVVGALVAVNPLGSVTMPHSPCFWAWPFEQAGEFGGLRPSGPVAALADLADCAPHIAGANTTIAVVATNADLDKPACRRLAIMAQDGLARAIRPAHTPFDGDTVFALATARGPALDPARLAVLGSLAADCLARAVARGVHAAESRGKFLSWRAHFGMDAGR